ncbi:S-adenosyl-L-methionine-dependent methyltransferase [Neocallimastix lanati (nom. inval.)]|jgi:16S rRNA C967 or C1407 C5-methylase (RsmB/RsmF family)|nr:S-adenosyl-L-methionine-dependent methyltransferase [Neocallimastix sp. JGI-2020a]
MNLGSNYSFSTTTIFDSLPSIGQYKRNLISNGSGEPINYSYSCSLSSLTEKDISSGILTPRHAIEYIYASDILEKIVNHNLMPNNYSNNRKASLESICTGRTKDNVYKLCYNTLKYMSYIDTILVKTQFLVYNNQFLSNLCLLKIMVYDLMRRHFNFTLWPGIIYDDIESSSNESLNNNNNLFSNLDLEDKQATSESTETVYSTSSKKHKKGHVTKKGNKHDKMSNSKNYKVADINGSMEEDLNVKSLSEENKNLLQKMEEALKAHEVKLAAAFARIRIERKANGTDLTEQLENILPMEVRNKESSASEMPKYFRINTLKQTKDQVFEELMQMGYRITNAPNSQENEEENSNSELNTVYYDIDLNDVIDVPACNYENLLNSFLVEEKILIPQDKASCLGPHHIFDIIPENMDIIDTIAGNGTRTSHLAALFNNSRKIFVFEKSLAKAEELKEKFIAQGVKNVEILCTDFLLTDPYDEKFSNVGAIICEPRSIGNAIIDKLGYMMQESEFPNEEYSKKDITLMRKNAENVLNHALKFPSTKSVTFISRTVKKEDNEAIISHLLEMENNIDKFELKCVLPRFFNETNYDYEFSECLKLRPNKYRNGIYIACLSRCRTMSKSEKAYLENGNYDELQSGDLTKSELALEQDVNMKKKKKLKKKIGKNIKKSKSTSSLSEKKKRASIGSSLNELKSNERINRNTTESSTTSLNKKISKSKKKLTESKQSINEATKNDTNDESESVGTLVEMAGNGGNLNKPGAEKINMDNLWIYGYSIANLQRFYAPQYDAMKHLNKKNLYGNKYPVPNPNPWK